MLRFHMNSVWYSTYFVYSVYPFRHTSTHIRVGFRIIQVTNNYISISLICESADTVNRTRTIFLLDSLASYWNTFIPYRQMGERGIEPLLFTTWEQIYSLPQHHQSLPFTPNFLCIAKNIRKEAVSTFFARVMLTGGLEPPFCTNAYSV